MKIKELLEKYSDIEITEDKVKELKELLEIKEKKKWSPLLNEEFWYISKHGYCYQGCWYGSQNDVFKWNNGNCFKTQEEAEFRLEQIKVYNELKNFADENNDEIDWNNPATLKYYITYYYNHSVLKVVNHHCMRNLGQIYFSSEELAKQAIEEVGEDRIKKYLFGVEDEKEN